MRQRCDRHGYLLASTLSDGLEFRQSRKRARYLVAPGAPRVCRIGHRLILLVVLNLLSFGLVQAQVTAVDFAREVERSLPSEELYDHHKQLSKGPVHFPRRHSAAKPEAAEMALPEQGWTLVWNRHSSPVLENAARDFQDYLQTSMQVRVTAESRDSLEQWEKPEADDRGWNA